MYRKLQGNTLKDSIDITSRSRWDVKANKLTELFQRCHNSQPREVVSILRYPGCQALRRCPTEAKQAHNSRLYMPVKHEQTASDQDQI